VHPSWTPEQKHADTIARDWARQQLLPWAAADNFATWYATSTVGRILFGEDDLDDAFEWWSAEQPDLTHPDE